MGTAEHAPEGDAVVIESGSPTPDWVAVGRGDAYVPFLLVGMTIGVVVAVDSRSLLILFAGWSVLWIVAHSQAWMRLWTSIGCRFVVNAGLAWTLLWVLMILTAERDGSDQGIWYSGGGWPIDFLIGWSCSGEAPLVINFGWLLGLEGDRPFFAPCMRNAPTVLANFLVAVMLTVPIAWLLPARWVPFVLGFNRLAAPLAVAIFVSTVALTVHES